MRSGILTILYLFMTINPNIKSGLMEGGISEPYNYAVANEPTPVFNSPNYPVDFGGKDGRTIKLDKEGLFRDLEYIALKGTIFTIKSAMDKGNYKIYNVAAEDYNYEAELYIDSRFVTLIESKPSSGVKKLPSKKDIYTFLDNAVGSKYIWGGNSIAGIDKMLSYYPPVGNISDYEKDIWTFHGCDCSGLMYEATNGYTERNTWKLIYFGKAVPIEGLSAEQIVSILKPLDMMVWNGHVIYVYDNTTAIQSALSKGGVVKTDLLETIENIMTKRTPVNEYDDSPGEKFVVRRWYNEN
jgi:hypothetical protein